MEKDFNYQKRIAKKREHQPFISQTDLVYELLCEDIVTLCYRAPGSKIKQGQLMNALGVSRTPIRDALGKLSEDHLITKRGKSGYHVYIPTMKDATHLCEFRMAIEIEAGKLASRRATAKDLELLRENIRATENCKENDLKRLILLDIEFHDRLLQCCKNDYMIMAYRNYRVQLRHLRNSSMTADMRDAIVSRHRSILQAIEKKNDALIENALRIHLRDNLEDSINANEFSYE